MRKLAKVMTFLLLFVFSIFLNEFFSQQFHSRINSKESFTAKISNGNEVSVSEELTQNVETVKIIEVEQINTDITPSLQIVKSVDDIEELEQSTEAVADDEENEANASEDTAAIEEDIDDIEEIPAHNTSLSQSKYGERVIESQRRREQRKNRKKANRMLRNDGYFIKKVKFQQIPSIIPAIPQAKVTQPYSLVLVTTADVSTNYHTYKIENVLRMFNLFQRMFNFRGIVFTSSPSIIDTAKRENITFISSITKNQYGMPILRDMLVKAEALFESDYYGYINSDIILSFNLFEILEICKQKAEKGVISLRHEIAGRVREIKLTKPLPHETLPAYFTYVYEASKQKNRFRHKHSADYFIFSRYFNFSSFDPAVIGRQKIDNYMLSIPHQRPETEEDQKYMVGTMDSKWKSKGHLIDVSYTVFGLHLGLDGYLTRIRKDHLVKDDVLWNHQYLRNYKLAFGSLAFAHYQFPSDYTCLKKSYLKKILNSRNSKVVH